MSALTVTAADPGSRARTGLLHTAHGDVRTPAFVPLATKGSVNGLEPHEVAGLGFDMVLGNTFHLFLQPGPELIDELGGLHRFMGWDGPIITDSGGFQVFSMGHGTVADEIKGRAPHGGRARGRASCRSRRTACASAPTSTAPSASWARRPRWRSRRRCSSRHRAGLRRVHAVPRHARVHRPLDRAHAPLARALPGLARASTAPPASWSTGSSRAASTRTCATTPPRPSPPARATASRSAARSDSDKEQMYEVVGWATAGRSEDRKPRHLLGIGDIDDLLRGVELGIDTFDCAMPTRLGRHGVAIVPEPDARWRVDLARRATGDSHEPILDGCPCPACAGGYSRATCATCSRPRELLGQRLVTLHNLDLRRPA